MNVKVYDIEGNLVTGYDYDEIRKFVLKKKAYWKSENAIQLTVSDKELNKRRTISKSLRKKVIMEEERTCYICGEIIDIEEDTTIDHLISVRNGGDNIRKNLRCCCSRCNLDKNNMNIDQYYDYIVSNREFYNYISNEQLTKLKHLKEKVVKNYPSFMCKIDDNKKLSIYINQIRSLEISENEDIDKIAVKIFDFLKSINENYVLDIIN